MTYRGRVFDGFELHDNAEFEIDQKLGKIKYIEDTNQAANKRDYNKFNVSDVTFLPGLIDTHIHFFGTESHSLGDWVLTSDVVLAVKSVYDAQKLLLSGFTAVRTMGDKVSLGLSKAEKDGSLVGPRIISSGCSIAESGGDFCPNAVCITKSLSRE